MISHIQAKSGFAAELKNLKDRRFDLLPGPSVTVLFGPNGCGKTSLLKLAAGYTGIPTSDRMFCGGWNRAPRFGDKAKYPDGFKENTIGHCEADVGWDGSPCFFNSALLSEMGTSMAAFVNSAEESPDGMMGFDEQVGLTMGHFSEGELRNHKIFKVVEALKKPPKVDKEARKWDKPYHDYVESLPRTGLTTLLWDEPDRSLSVEMQIAFWTRFVLGLASKEKVQVVVSSHSLVLLHMPQTLDYFKIVDVEEGYLDKSKQQMKEIMAVAQAVDDVRMKIKEEAEAKRKSPTEEPTHADEAGAAKVRGSQKRGKVPGKDTGKGKKGKTG